jgi:hypothetical protein
MCENTKVLLDMICREVKDEEEFVKQAMTTIDDHSLIFAYLRDYCEKEKNEQSGKTTD